MRLITTYRKIVSIEERFEDRKRKDMPKSIAFNGQRAPHLYRADLFLSIQSPFHPLHPAGGGSYPINVGGKYSRIIPYERTEKK